MAIAVRGRGRPVESSKVGLGRSPGCRSPPSRDPRDLPLTQAGKMELRRASVHMGAISVVHFWKIEVQEKTSL